MGGQRRKTNPKSLGPAFSLCRRAGIDASLAKPDFFYAGAPTIENKIERKTQNTKVASAKVAFDTVQGIILAMGPPENRRRPKSMHQCCARGPST